MSEWTESAIATLKADWAAGYSTTEIGRRMHMSKNAVVGKAHRLNLPARPSPIKRDGAPKPVRPPRVGKVTLPVMAAPVVVIAPVQSAPVQSAPVQSAPLQVAPILFPPPVVRREAAPGARRCVFPIGTPKTPGFRFCEAALPSTATRRDSYCAEHHARCWHRPVRPDQRGIEA